MNKIMKSLAITIALALGLGISASCFANTYPLPTGKNDVVGKLRHVYAKRGDTLADVGRRHGIGIIDMMYANPGLKSNTRLRRGKKLLVPGKFILPAGPRKGVVVNLAELRLYYYPPGKGVVFTAPVGIGRQGTWQTPTGSTKIVEKRKDPVWRPTSSVRAEAAANGTPIPKVFPAGPDNPLGRYAMRLGWRTYLIHSTNRPAGVGSRVSAGCIRMFPEDIKDLYAMMSLGTEVQVINKPFKAGWDNGRLYFEAHKPLIEDRDKYQSALSTAISTIKRKAGARAVSAVQWKTVKKAVKYFNGMPYLVNHR